MNPVAGGGRAEQVLGSVEAALEALGVSFHVERTTDIEHARALARGAVDGGERVATLGGDGLVGAVAGVLRGTGTELAVLPGGRGNDFARVLGIGQDPAAACSLLVEGEPRDLDIGDVAGRTFVGIASAGFDSDANRIANEARLIRGNGVYAYAAIKALWQWRPARFTVDLDERERVEFSGYSVVAANSKAYGGGMYIAPDAQLDDGRLDVVLTGSGPKRRFVVQLPRVFRGEHVNSPSVHVRRAREVRFAADRPFMLYADGDPIGELPVTVRVGAGELRVLVPPGGPPADLP